MKNFWIDARGQWSGGGHAVLNNWEFARTYRPELFSSEWSDGCIAILPRNIPTIGASRRLPYVWMPQNALPWARIYRAEWRRQAILRLGSWVTGMRSLAMLRISPSIPAPSRKPTSPVIANVLDLTFESILDKVDTLEAADFFVSPGSAHAYRNLPRLIRGYGAYRRSGGRVELVVQLNGGSTHEMTKIREEAARTPGVRLIEAPATRTEAVRLMSASRGVILPSEVEASPVTLLEAEALGLQVACSDIPGHRLMTRESLFFDSRDEGACSAAIGALDVATAMASSRVDRELRDPGFRAAERTRWAASVTDFLERVAHGRC